MLDVVCWLWRPTTGYRSQFDVGHVNTLQRMIARNYPHTHRFSCITDHREGFSPEVRIIPLWDDFGNKESLYGPDMPSCYRRLKAFSPEMEQVIGPRFVSLDLDVVITGDLTSVFNRSEDFVIWGDPGRRTPYNGSMWMMNAGARAHVWENFIRRPDYAIGRARSKGYYGTDQAWISYCLGADEPRWTGKDGVFSYRMHVKPENGRLPENARIVFFEGHYDPWNPSTRQQCPWIDQHYN